MDQSQDSIPDAAPETADASGSTSRKRSIPLGVKFGAVILAVVGVIGGSLVFNINQVGEEPSRVSGAPNIDTTPAGQQQAESPRFREILQQSNDQRADEALSRGETFIPAPEMNPVPVEIAEPEPVAPQPPEEVVQREAEPEPRAERVVRVSETVRIPTPPAPVERGQIETASPNQQNEDPMRDLLLQQMGSISSSMTRTTSMGAQLQTSAERQRVIEERNAAAEAAATSFLEREAERSSADATVQIVPAGDILYAETLTSSTSDLPGPVLVEITAGPLTGSRLIGSFTVGEREPRMMISFNTMTLPDGESVSVSAFAVDGVTAETAVASDVDRRYVARYAPILAASFIAGYGGALAEPAQAAVPQGDDITVVTEAADNEQAFYSGIAAASSAIAGDLVETAPRGPEIKLRSGYPVAIMFAEPVLRTK